MSLSEITRSSVEAAMAEYDRLGRDRFLEKYQFGRSRRYVVYYDGNQYDSKALIGGAHRHATGAPLGASDFSGGVATVGRLLSRLGFDFRDLDITSNLRLDTTWTELSGVEVGTVFANRAEAAAAGVHRALQAGIVGTARTGAESVVVSGGYEDDDDDGSQIVYTGHGGRNSRGKQVSDQSFSSPGNAALQTSLVDGVPVRVIRGPNKRSPYAPESGYRYDGLFRVEEAWQAEGKSGFVVCRFRLVQLGAEPLRFTGGRRATRQAADVVPPGNTVPTRQLTSVQRVVRSTAVAIYVKRLHDFTCQACGVRLDVGDRGYAEGAHIRPLGRPHNGPDIAANVLCLCPNCHVLFDTGALVIEGETVIVNGRPQGTLHVHEAHWIDPEHLEYHRSRHQPTA